MRYLKLLIILALFSQYILGTTIDIPIGKERIQPLEFPKFSLNASYNTFRYGGISGESLGRIATTYGTSIAFDVGLYQYLHAGAALSLMGNPTSKYEPLYYRFNIFVRPLVSFFEQISIFSRIGIGLGIIYDSPIESLKEALPTQISEKIRQKYDSKYYGEISPGFHGSTSIGIEYFPFSRVGFSLEGGVLVDYLHVSKSKQLKNKLEKEMGGVPTIDNAPHSFGYFALEIPITLALNIIF